MSTVQTIARRMLPAKWFGVLEASSRRWMIQCTRCGEEKSVWDAGGIRWGGASYGKRIAARCTYCQQIVAARIYYSEEEVHYSEVEAASSKSEEEAT